MSVSALTGEIRPSKIRIDVIKKRQKNFVYPNLWPPRVSWLQDLTFVQQYLYVY